MQIKLFSIPILVGEKLTEEMNAFLRSKKVLRKLQERWDKKSLLVSQKIIDDRLFPLCLINAPLFCHSVRNCSCKSSYHDCTLNVNSFIQNDKKAEQNLSLGT